MSFFLSLCAIGFGACMLVSALQELGQLRRLKKRLVTFTFPRVRIDSDDELDAEEFVSMELTFDPAEREHVIGSLFQRSL